MADRRLLTTRETAQLLRVSEMWLKRRRRDGLAPTPIRLGKLVRYDARDIDAFLAAGKAGAA